MQPISLANADRNAGRFALLQPITRLAVGALLAIAAPVFAGQSVPKIDTASPVWQKPAWVTDLSLSVRESYDTNVYADGASFTPPATGPVAWSNKDSWATTVSPKIGADFARLLGSDSIFKILSLGYNPDVVTFHNAPSESYTMHRITTTVQAKADPVTVKIDNAVSIIDGDHDGLIYPGGSSSFCNSTVRERRAQWQERSKVSVQADFGSFFFRPTASLLYYDLDTFFSSTPNYTNYVDRYDLNGGADFGYKVTKDLALTLGYRYGHQFQEKANPTDSSVTNDYQRVLVGIEGSPFKWLKVEALAGPQFTDYTDHYPATIKDATPTLFYGEASVTIAPTNADTLVFKYKHWNWVSSTGKNAYMEVLYDASYRHQITKDLQLQLGFRAAQSDYNPSALRDDWLYTSSAGLRYALTKNLSVEMTYAYDRGENQQEGITNAAGREFDRSVVSTGMTWAF